MVIGIFIPGSVYRIRIGYNIGLVLAELNFKQNLKPIV